MQPNNGEYECSRVPNKFKMGDRDKERFPRVCDQGLLTNEGNGHWEIHRE